jgi:hypothetical protein
MFARQMGKNELSAHLEAYLLGLYSGQGGNIVKAAPTFKPQVISSKERLEWVLSNPMMTHMRTGSWGFITRVKRAKCVFYSGEREANVVGETASLLLEVDEAQDFDQEKYQRDFRPMASAHNATTVLYGTAWSEDDLLARTKATNLELEARDGIRRHYQYPWTVLAEISPQYKAFVEGERALLGPEHPLFLTQYELVPLPGAGRLFSPALLAQLQGEHARRPAPVGDRFIIAGLDLAGEGEHADRSVLTLAEVEQVEVGGIPQAVARVVEHVAWRGVNLAELQLQLVDLLGRVWHVRRIAVDATGLGLPVASFLISALGEVVDEVVFSQVVKSRLGYGLLAAIGTGRLRMYAGEGEEPAEFWREAKLCRREVLPGQLLRWAVPAEEGHDDYVTSLALVAFALDSVTAPAAGDYVPAPDILKWGWPL